MDLKSLTSEYKKTRRLVLLARKELYALKKLRDGSLESHELYLNAREKFWNYRSLGRLVRSKMVVARKKSSRIQARFDFLKTRYQNNLITKKEYNEFISLRNKGYN